MTGALRGGRALVVIALVMGAITAVGTVPSAGTPVLHPKVIGYSVRHRPIVAYELGDPHAPRVAVVLGEMHGDEHAGVRVVNALVHGTRRVTGLSLWVVPTMNPDGDAAHRRTNAHHVDLNRNFPVRWAHLTGQYYSGPRPLSEPETRAVWGFLRTLRPHDVVSLHQPLYGVDTTDGGQLDPALRRGLAHQLGLPSKPFRCWSACHGTLTRWYTARRYGVAITVEFGWHPSARYLTTTAPAGIVTALGGRLR